MDYNEVSLLHMLTHISGAVQDHPKFLLFCFLSVSDERPKVIFEECATWLSALLSAMAVVHQPRAVLIS